MSPLFPAILLGGPPQRGKSVVGSILSQHLHARQVPCYRLAANPDGEGHWFQEAPRAVAVALRRKQPWDAPFEQALATILARRAMPLLVDVGGRPTPTQQALFSFCTHAILLGANHRERVRWRGWRAQHQLQPLAEIRSVREPVDRILSENPLRLQLGALERQRPWQSATSDPWLALLAAVERALGWQAEALWQFHARHAPAGTLPINLDFWLAGVQPGKTWWEPALLPRLLAELPTDAPLALYGGRPSWLVAAVAIHAQPPLALFDARYGWLPLPDLDEAERGEWKVEAAPQAGGLALSFALHNTLLTPAARLAGPLAAPPDTPLLLDGKLPNWLLGALARHYARCGNTVAIALPRTTQAVWVHGAQLGQVVAWQPPSE